MELVYTDIIEPFYPEQQRNFGYIHKFSYQETQHLAVYYGGTKGETVRLLKEYHPHDLATENESGIKFKRTHFE